MGDMRVSSNETAETILAMLSSARTFVDLDPGRARRFIDQASRLLEPTTGAPPSQQVSLGLAPWQVRKVTRYVAENLHRPISSRELADLATMSTSHFSRTFKQSLGSTPREYVLLRRVARARTMMLETRLSLCQIALDCGFADQAHMCRIFHRAVGVPPGRWRRANRASGDEHFGGEMGFSLRSGRAEDDGAPRLFTDL